MKEIIVKVIGKQKNIEGEENTVELTTEGKYYNKKGVHYVIYEESEVSGMEGATTTLKIEPEKITMRRYGTHNSQLVFEKGKKHETPYDTNYGQILMEVTTTKMIIAIDEAEQQGKIKIAYHLKVGNITETENKLEVIFRGGE